MRVLIRFNFFILIAGIMWSCKSSPPEFFTDVSETSGITFSNNITENEQDNIFTYEYMYNGAGVAIGDVNNDGLPDIFFTANQLRDQLYLNKGNLSFQNITEAANVGGKSGWKTGVSMADVNADGLLDIYVCYSGKGDAQSRDNQLFINKGIKDGIPVFADEAAAYGLNAPGTNSTQSLFFDYDRDGDLDMFLLNHAVIFYSPLVNTYKLRHKRHPWYSNYLFRNDNGHFTDVSAEAGIAGGGNNFGLGMVAADINTDGWPDLYMTNDYEEQDFLLLNNQDGTFREVTKQSLKHISRYGMGCDVADYNNDGLPDIMVPDMWPEDNYRQKVLRGPDEFDKYNLLVDSGYMHQNMRNTLQLNQGLNKEGLPVFSEIGQLAGVSNTDWSWSSLFADFDNDDNKDLYITNGFWRDFSNMDFQTYQAGVYIRANGPDAPLHHLLDSIPRTSLSHYMFRNKGDLCFDNVTSNWNLEKKNVSNGSAYADLDNDGDLDLVVNNMGERASIYRNNNLSNGNYLKIKLKGLDGNRDAIGARITIETPGGKKQMAELQPVRGYLSCMTPLVHFGLGTDTLIAAIFIDWPNGTKSSFEDLQVNRLLTFEQEGAQGPDGMGRRTKIYFEDYTKPSGIAFYQPENQFVDFYTERLLPWQLSKQGPKMCKGDINRDGLEDIFIGAPQSGKSCLYVQGKEGRFAPAASQPWNEDSGSDIVQSAFFDPDGDGDLDLYVVSGGNENPDPAQYQDRLFLNNGKGQFSKLEGALPEMNGSKSCVAVADFNNDRKPDLFVGGRVVPGKYGVIPRSFLLLNKTVNGQVKFVDVTSQAAPALQYPGMVTSAVWTDLNQDKIQDLLLAGEWMGVKAFINQNNQLKDASVTIGLENSEGLWTCIVPMDLDEDGDMDYLLGNLAPNTQFNASADQPMSLYVNDFSGTGKTSALLFYSIKGESRPYASRNEMVDEFPWLKKKFLYYRDYAVADLGSIFTADQRVGMQELKARHLKNCWLENSNGKLTIHELPVPAQFSPIQNAMLTDINQDGQKEILAVGNFYPFRVQLGREDGGTGILIQWDKKAGKLTESRLNKGVFIDGDIRDALQVQTAAKDNLIIVSKNNDSVQVIKYK
jgi:enediyne biosynthesis protein E4